MFLTRSKVLSKWLDIIVSGWLSVCKYFWKSFCSFEPMKDHILGGLWWRIMIYLKDYVLFLLLLKFASHVKHRFQYLKPIRIKINIDCMRNLILFWVWSIDLTLIDWFDFDVILSLMIGKLMCGVQLAQKSTLCSRKVLMTTLPVSGDDL